MSHRHAADAVSLVFGTVFAGLAIVWILAATGTLDRHDAWLAGPIVLLVGGLMGLVVALRQDRDQPPPITD